MKKITKKEMFTMIMGVVANTEVENKAEMLKALEHEIELLEKKSSKSGQSKTQKENEILKAEILESFKEIEIPVTVSEFQNLTRFRPENDFSNQKVSALLNQLVKNGLLEKTIEKKKSFFSLPKAE